MWAAVSLTAEDSWTRNSIGSNWFTDHDRQFQTDQNHACDARPSGYSMLQYPWTGCKAPGVGKLCAESPQMRFFAIHKNDGVTVKDGSLTSSNMGLT